MTTESSPSAAPLPENLALLDKAVFNQQVATILRLARERTSDIRKLNPHQYPEATVQINQELFAGLIGQADDGKRMGATIHQKRSRTRIY